VLLLLEGKTGNTVVDMDGNQISYMPTPEAIKRREVDTAEIALFESLGTCFGRKPEKFVFELIEKHAPIARHF